MLVSIIIPIHKTTPYLKECVHSALGQTHKDIEVFAICNGDLSTKQCSDFLGIQDDRLHFINSTPGRHSARNMGLEEARGDYVQYLDYDDILMEDKIEQQLLDLGAMEAISICKWKRFHNNIKEDYIFPFTELFEQTNLSVSKLYELLGITKGFIATASWLLPSTLAKMAKWEEVPNDDAVYFSKIIESDTSIKMLPKVAVGVRMHADNTSEIRTHAELDLLIDGWEQIKQQLTNKEILTRDIYLYAAYAYLLGISKRLGNYRRSHILKACLRHGRRAKINFKILSKQIKYAYSG